MKIIRVVGSANITKLNRVPQYIVIHYTAGTQSKKGTAKAIANMFSKVSTKASADYIVDDDDIVQYNPSVKDYYCWAVGGDKYSSMSTSQGGKYYGKCTNRNSISIEVCSSKKNTKTLNASDTDWYFSDATLNNAVELTKYLMDQFLIPESNVIMHHHVTGKVCPNPFCVNEKALDKWSEFKKRIGGVSTTKTTNTNKSSAPKCAKPTLKRGSAGEQVVLLQKDLNYSIKSGLVADGVFGAGTEQALKTWQKKNKLTSDGIYGEKSQSKMNLLLK